MASHESALKAHRQNVKRREHNRQLRTRLRGALGTSARPSTASDPKTVTDALRADDLARGQDGGEGADPPEHRRPLQVAPRDARRQARRPPSVVGQLSRTTRVRLADTRLLSRRTTASSIGASGRHNSTTRRSSSTRASPPELFRSRSVRKQRFDRRPYPAGIRHRQLLANEPRELTENHKRNRAGIERQPKLSQRLGECRRAGSRS